MFERYTEKARRAIYYSRFEASQLGSLQIETQHLLLGVLREDRRVVGSLAKREAAEWIRAKVKAAIADGGVRTPTSIDLPLANECKQAMRYAAEEADRLNHAHIGCEHLFLGLLRESESQAAKILTDLGVDLENAREQVAKLGSRARPALRNVEQTGCVEIHGDNWAANYVLPLVEELRTFHWEKATWKPRDILVHKENGSVWFYVGQQYDGSMWELKSCGWPRDRCRICRWELCANAGSTHAEGYTNGRDWICGECHYKFIGPFAKPAEDYT